MDTLTQLRSGMLAGATRLDLNCGLGDFPREVFDLADSLEILNLSQNQLSSLPDDLGRLRKLRILFCSENQFRHLPAVVGDCPALSMVGFKANRIESVDARAFPPALRWLILTDNCISELPAAMGRCTRLQKLMLSGNQLRSLPEEMAGCMGLEMVRVASNQLQSLPAWLLRLPELSWLAFGGNPCCASPPTAPQDGIIPWKLLSLHQKLGDGASGVVHRASWSAHGADPEPVAVKLFKSAVTSDGLASSEIAASMAAGRNPHLIGALGMIEGHPEGRAGLVMPLVAPEFHGLAGPPSFETCTRDVYEAGLTLTSAMVLNVALGVASAAGHLHAQHIMHGDIYAHNVLWRSDGQALLGDLGAASFYPADGPVADALQGIEVRAWGCLLGELISLCAWEQETLLLRVTLQSLLDQCLHNEVRERPGFQAIQRELERLKASQ